MRLIRNLVILSVVLALALSACAPATPTPGATPPAAAALLAPVAGAAANFRLLISDAPNAIGDFQSLVVTISRIGVLRATPAPSPTPTATPTPTPTPTPGEGHARWFEFEPQVKQVDLVQLQGKSAMAVWDGSIPPGRYLKVFIYVDSVEGTLQDGTKVSVKLPSGKLQISKPFEVTADGTVDFVFDFTVIAAGSEKSPGGIKYILLPQLTQSGPDQPFYELKFKGTLNVKVEGEILPGKTITLVVTDFQGNPLAGATVTIKDAPAGTTDSQGRFEYAIPATARKIDIRVRSDGLRGELEIEFERPKGRLHIGVTGDIQPGKSVTITVTDRKGKPVAAAEVTIDDEAVGTTDDKGQLQLTIPPDARELDIEVRLGDQEGELEIDLKQPKGRLHLSLEGEAKPGATVALTVTFQGQPAAGATVTLNGTPAGTTDAQGRLSALTIPADAEEVKIEARQGERKGELKLKLVEERAKKDHRQFRGTITAITDGTPGHSPWTMSIPGVRDAVTVVVSDAEEIEGTPTVGATAEVEGVVEEGVIYAREAEVGGEKEKPGPRGRLGLRLEGQAKPGATVALTVTFQGQPVAGATVTMNEASAGTTDASGQISLTVPDDEELEVKARHGEQEGELEVKIEKGRPHPSPPTP